MRRLTRFLRSTNLAPATWAVLVAAAMALAGSVTVLTVTTEDVTQHNGLSSSDAAHLRFFVDHRSDQLIHAAKVVTEAGAAPLLALMAMTVAAVLWWRGTRLVVAVAPAVALGCAGAVATVAKQVVGRERPPVGLRLVSETEPSFPSGHATDSAAFYLTLALVVAVFVLRRPLARLVTVAAGVVTTGSIGLSRMLLGLHWPTDVLAGWALGTTTALAVVLAVGLLTRLTPPGTEGARLRMRLLVFLNARRSPDLQAVSPALSASPVRQVTPMTAVVLVAACSLVD